MEVKYGFSYYFMCFVWFLVVLINVCVCKFFMYGDMVDGNTFKMKKQYNNIENCIGYFWM